MGSLFFTAAAALQWREEGGWSSALQLLGTIAFNATTLRALGTALDSSSYDRLVWRPDAVGSLFFLASGCLGYAQVSGGALRLPPRTRDGAIAAVNLFGCVAFGVSAVAGFVVPATGSEADVAVADGATAVGALAFLVGALLLLGEGAPRSRPAASPDGPPSDGPVSRPAQ